ncbi:MAG: peptidylprolyl isomerase [Clostridia bacterium]|nr:peptidylprolyl isomerase [Clostridia bacterium]
MNFELFPERAPITVASFAQSANEGFYDGLGICRIVDGYVIQAGSPDNDIMTDSNFHIRGEFAKNGVNTGLDHRRGALSMARDEDFDTAGTQFFVVHRDAYKLDGYYAAFGYMLEGFDVLDALASLPTSCKGTWNKPLHMPLLQRVRVKITGEGSLPPVQRLP